MRHRIFITRHLLFKDQAAELKIFVGLVGDGCHHAGNCNPPRHNRQNRQPDRNHCAREHYFFVRWYVLIADYHDTDDHRVTP